MYEVVLSNTDMLPCESKLYRILSKHTRADAVTLSDIELKLYCILWKTEVYTPSTKIIIKKNKNSYKLR